MRFVLARESGGRGSFMLFLLFLVAMSCRFAIPVFGVTTITSVVANMILK